MSEPTKAFYIKYKVVNEVDALVYAESPTDARRRFEAGEIESTAATGVDYRTGGIRVSRCEADDRESVDPRGDQDAPSTSGDAT